jgi:hypothetical protein
MSNQKDQEFVRGALSESAMGLMEFLPSMRNAEAIAVGEGVPVPVRLCFNELPEERRPRSGTAKFSTAWQSDARGAGPPSSPPPGRATTRTSPSSTQWSSAGAASGVKACTAAPVAGATARSFRRTSFQKIPLAVSDRVASNGRDAADRVASNGRDADPGL